MVIRPRAAKKSGERYRGVGEAADRFMTKWHRDESERSWLQHAVQDAKRVCEGRGGEGRRMGRGTETI